MHFSEDFQNMIDSKRKTGSADPEQMHKMFLVFQKLIPALDAIRYEYEQWVPNIPKFNSWIHWDFI